MEKVVETNKGYSVVQTMCRFCLCSVAYEYCDIMDKDVIDILGILLPKWNLDEGRNLICKDCSTKLFAAFDFKGTCVNTEDCIFPYVNSGKGGFLDLREIYLKENDSELSFLKIRNVCRLCMQLIFDELICFEQLDINMLNIYIPEINFSSTKCPVICKACYEAFKFHCAFLKMCLENEKKAKYDNGINYLKTKEIDLKSEEIHIKTKKTDLNTEENERDSEEIAKENNKIKCDIGKATSDQNNQMRVKKKKVRWETPKILKCDECNFQTRYKVVLSNHQVTHRDPSEIQIFKCDKCRYQTDREKCLRKHMRTHRGRRKKQIYKCDRCSYEAKWKKDLSCHKLTHLDIHKCKECSYETSCGSNLRVHMLAHKDICEVQTHKCDQCPGSFNGVPSNLENLENLEMAGNLSEPGKSQGIGTKTSFGQGI